MSAPDHQPEHDQLIQLVGKLMQGLDRIHGVILITIGTDGRPCIGSNLASTDRIIEVLRLLADADNEIENEHTTDIPRDN